MSAAPDQPGPALVETASPESERPARPARPALRHPVALVLTALLPALLVLGYDIVSRREIFVARSGPPIEGYVGGAALSLAVWGLSLEAARHPRRAVRIASWVVLGLTASFGVGGQILFFSTTHDYFNRNAALFSMNRWPTILHYLASNPVESAAIFFVPAGIAVGYGELRHRMAGPRRQLAHVGSALALVACLFTAFGPLRVPAVKHGLPPEILFWHAAGGIGLYAAGVLQRPKMLPPGEHAALAPSPAPAGPGAPDVILIFGESVRRDAVCVAPSADCKSSPRVDAAAPGRIGFRRSFGVSSCTEISSAILWSGLPIWSTSEAMQSAPLLWDYAHARGYRTAYLTSQNLRFQDQGLFLRSSRIDHMVEARDRDPHVDLDLGTDDETTAGEALSFLAGGGGPSFVVLHFSNTHLPYRQVEGHTPWPADGDSSTARRARYWNSLVHQDAVIGDFLDRLRSTERGRSAVVVYTADHGEAWGEHDSYTHTFDLYAEQIDVPLWIDAPEGALSAAQREALAAAGAERPVFTADVTATLLDLMGALDEGGFAERTSVLAGVSALRPPPAPRDMEISNCPPFRSCFPDAWGVVRWPLKYHHVGRDNRDACSDLAADPGELSPLAPEACGPLRDSLAGKYTTP